MNLADPSLGAVVDRLTILSLKILFGNGKDTSHFQREQTKLMARIRARQDVNGSWFAHVLDLAAVNAALWHKEDEMRAIRADINMTQNVPGSSLSAHMQSAGEVGTEIQRLNDQRADLIARIDKEAGETAGPEKL